MMGMNYYLHKPACPSCGRSDEPVHIGKSSCGWVFALHVARPGEEGLPHDLEEWKAAWSEPDVWIKDEDNKNVTPEEMLRIITERSHPNGLRRAPLDEYCIGYGPGTWELSVGSFS